MANEKRVLLDAARGTIGAVTATGGSITSTGFSKLPALATSEHFLLTLDPLGAGNGPEIVKVTAHSASSTSATITRAAESGAFTATAAVAHSAGTAWILGSPRSMFPRMGISEYNKGSDITLSTTGAWTNLLAGEGASATALDIALAAQVGDVVAVWLNLLNNSGTGNSRSLDVGTIKTPNLFGQAAGIGQPGWFESIAAQYGKPSGAAWKRLDASDITSGVATIRAYYKLSAGTMTLYCNTVKIQMVAVNFGPQPFIWG